MASAQWPLAGSGKHRFLAQDATRPRTEVSPPKEDAPRSDPGSAFGALLLESTAPASSRGEGPSVAAVGRPSLRRIQGWRRAA